MIGRDKPTPSARPVRVAFLNPTGILGGAERCLLDLVASLRDADSGIACHLIATDEGPLLEEASLLGATVEHLPLPEALAELGDSALAGERNGAALFDFSRRAVGKATAAPSYGRRLRRSLDHFGPTVVHSNGAKFHLLSGLPGSTSAPVVWHVRDMLSERPLVAKALRLMSRRVSRAIAISNLVGEDLRRVLPRVPAEVVYDAIDTDHFAPGAGDGPALDRLAGFDTYGEGVLRVGLVATFARWKGQDLFLDAIARLPETIDGRRVRFFVIGGPVYRTKGSQFSEAELRALASEHGVLDRVGFVGFRSDVAELFRSLDVVVHASTRPEPFGRTIAEAMSCARPVVAARGSGAAELFADGEEALTFASGDADDLARQIRLLAADESLRARLGERGRARAVEDYSRRRIGLRMLAIYRDIMNGQTRRASHGATT